MISEVDPNINSLDDILKKWKGKILCSKLIDEIKTDFGVYIDSKCNKCRKEKENCPVERDVYRFIDLAVQFHYKQGHYL